jgi:hypothetical protein
VYECIYVKIQNRMQIIPLGLEAVFHHPQTLAKATEEKEEHEFLDQAYLQIT